MKTYIFIFAAFTFFACGKHTNQFDASGAFETEETIISAEAAGLLKEFNIAEGQTLQAGQMIGYIDSVQLHLRRKQLESQIKSILTQRPNIGVQVAALQTQLKTAERESLRVMNLLKSEAATQKQLDDITSQTELIRKQIAAQQSALGIATEGINEQTAPLRIQIEQLNDQISKCRVVNPLKGTVLTTYTQANEVVGMGKPLYKIADLSSLILRAYITGDQLPALKLNQKLKVFTDDSDGNYKEYEGTLQWISDKAEFTPKTIQTKNERANLVYAVKIRVVNAGSLKIGMYGEVKF